jgi:DNA-binding CsgD family transcriptional regulator
VPPVWSVDRCSREVVRLAHSGLDRASFFPRVAALLQHGVQFDGGCWHTHDPATLLITSHYTNLDGSGFPFVCMNEYLEDDVNKFSALAGRPSPVGILSDATEEHPERSPRYRSLYGPRGWGSELRATFDVGGSTWGSVMLLREEGRPDFTARDAELISSLSAHLAHAIRTALLAAAPDDGDGTPGMLVLAPGGELEGSSAAAERWLDELADDPPTALPAAILSVAAKARTADGSPELGPARARLLAPSGRWVVLHAALLDEHAGGRVAVIVEPARPTEITPLLADAYGLTARERDVLGAVLRGQSTKQIASLLFVTEYTVQDHLKSIFEKTGVRRRSELAGRLFFDHFQPRVHGDAPLAAGGGFRS